MKTHARVVIIGGGAMGVGILYHLTKEGWKDVVLVEKGELTSGSTWHAAGLIPHFIASLNLAKIHYYGSELYKNLEEETGQATGWHGCGAVRLAVNQDQVDWFHYVKGILAQIGAECHLLGPDEIKEVHPLLNTDGVLLGAYTTGDGHTDPSGVTHAMAIGAKNRGAEIYRNNRVTEINSLPSGEWEVVTGNGKIVCEHVVNAAGSFCAQVGAMVGLKIPVVNMVHQYLMTETIPEVAALKTELPVVRDPRSSCYYRQEQSGLIIGPYEMNAKAWGLDGIDWSFDNALLPPDLERLEPHLELAARSLPVFETAGIKKVVSGPITHTPDGNFLLGPAPGLRNHWMCCAASIGITQGPGCGKYLAQWMVHGQTEINVREFDPRRYGDWSCGNYALDKSIDEYERMYATHYPGEFTDAGRPVRTTPIYEKLKAQGAVFAETFGWERAKWFDTKGEGEKYSFRRNNTFAVVAEECRAVRERVGLLDLTSFSKYEISGTDAESFLNRICANRIPKLNSGSSGGGGVALVHMLTEIGGIECEATITYLAENHFYVLSAAVAELHDFDWLNQHILPPEAPVAEKNVSIRNVTDDFGVLVLSGPRSRDVLSKLTDADLSNEAFRWMHGKSIEVSGIPLRALRVSYVGELGWELHHPIDKMETLYDALMETGEEYEIANFGTYAMNSLRMEKAYKGWGAELTTEITPIESGLERFVDFSKSFIGREATLSRKLLGVNTKLVYVSVETADSDCLGNEPVLAPETPACEKIIGVTTSGAYGHTVGQSLVFAYVQPQYAEPGTQFEIRVLGQNCPATVLKEAAYDPQNLRLRDV